MNDSFKKYHPSVNFTYFAFAIIFSMFYMNLIFLSISFFVSICYYTFLSGIKGLRKTLLMIIPIIIGVSIFNPLFNHQGVTILFYLKDSPITLESVIYGFASALMFASVIMWFSCYNFVVTSDKFIFIFGRIIPSIALIFSMVLAFVPKFRNQIKIISNAQKCIGKDISSKNIFTRVKNAIKVVSILTTWALENSIDTSDSMKSRGYGLNGRTSFSNYTFRKSDLNAVIYMSVLIIVIIIGEILKVNSIIYFPIFKLNEMNFQSNLIYISYFLFFSTPLLINVKEEIKWNYSKLKI